MRACCAHSLVDHVCLIDHVVQVVVCGVYVLPPRIPATGAHAKNTYEYTQLFERIATYNTYSNSTCAINYCQNKTTASRYGP